MAVRPDVAHAEVLRVSVVGGHDRVDLVVPAAVSVAELLPELVRRLGGGDPRRGPDELRLSVVGGPPLVGGSGLAAQGVPDGAVLTVTAAADHVAAVDDDLTGVVAEVVEALPRPASGVAARVGVAAAASLLGLAALGTLTDGSPATAVASATAVIGLLAAAAVTAARDGPAAVVGVGAWLAVAHAGAAGAVVGPAGAGAAWLVAGGVAALATGRRAHALWAAPAAGAVLTVAGAVAALAPVSLSVALTCALVLVVVTGDLVPWLAATLAGLVPPPLGEQPPRAPDRDAVDGAVRRAHDVLLTCSVATGLLLVVLGPVVAGQGWWGVAVVLLCCVVVALRSRRQRVGRGGLAGLVGAVAPLLPVAVAVWLRWPARHPEVLAGVLVLGLLVLATTVLPTPRTARAGRLAELAEALALVALPPALLAATGLLDTVRELVG